jgi:integrase
MIVGIAVLTAALDFWTSAELAGSVLFAFALVLCITRRSKWLLWGTGTMAVLLNVAPGFWRFHRIALLNPRVASVNRGLLMVSLLTLTTLVHLWINKSRKAVLDAAAIQLHNNELIARNEQLEHELVKIETLDRGKRKPLVLTIKQYQAFVGHLSDLHRTMVVTAMCSGLRVSEVLALRWDQLDFPTGVMSIQQRVANGGTSKVEGSDEQISMDPVLVEALLEWRNKTLSTGLVFPSHITGRCYHAGPIQQDYFRPAARKLDLVGVCWNTFPHSYRSWMDEHGTPAGVQQKLMRHAAVSPIMHNHSKAASKHKGKANGKVVRRVLPTAGFQVGVSADPP